MLKDLQHLKFLLLLFFVFLLFCARGLQLASFVATGQIVQVWVPHALLKIDYLSLNHT